MNTDHLRQPSIPAGKCPVSPSKDEMDNPTQEGVIDWANQVIDVGLNNNTLYRCSAVQYWARHFLGYQ